MSSSLGWNQSVLRTKHRILFSTYKISTPTGTGSGFLWEDPNGFHYLITNKHVVNYQPTGIARGNALDGTGDEFTIRLHLGTRGAQESSYGFADVRVTDPVWVGHNQDVDLCVFNLTDAFAEVQQRIQQEIMQAQLTGRMAEVWSGWEQIRHPLNTLVRNGAFEDAPGTIPALRSRLCMIGCPRGITIPPIIYPY